MRKVRDERTTSGAAAESRKIKNKKTSPPGGWDGRAGVSRSRGDRHRIVGNIRASAELSDRARSPEIPPPCSPEEPQSESTREEPGVGSASVGSTSPGAGVRASSLRLRLVALITLALLVSLAAGAALIYEHALRKVRTEMNAAIAVGQHIVRNAVDNVEEAVDPGPRMRLIIANFDGDRHLRASLFANDGALLASSTLANPTDPAPDWFYGLIAEQPVVVTAALPKAFDGHGKIELQTDARNEIAETWSDIKVTLAILFIFCGLVLGLVYWILGYALHPLRDLSDAFAQLGSGNQRLSVAERGPSELLRLCRGFNEMVVRLATMDIQNRRLQEQLLAVQEDERADLARDLHDEIGPFLFAAGIDATTIRQFVANGRYDRIPARLDAICAAITHAQKQVKAILGRLRPELSPDLGLGYALGELVTFWREHRPQIDFEISLSQESFGTALDSAIYRVVQESVNNAIRHGHPGRIEISVLRDPDNTAVVSVTDDGRGLPPGGAKAGFGLVGMRERAESLGGTLTIRDRQDRRGVIVSARLPSDSIRSPSSGDVHMAT